MCHTVYCTHTRHWRWCWLIYVDVMMLGSGMDCSMTCYVYLCANWFRICKSMLYVQNDWMFQNGMFKSKVLGVNGSCCCCWCCCWCCWRPGGVVGRPLCSTPSFNLFFGVFLFNCRCNRCSSVTTLLILGLFSSSSIASIRRCNSEVNTSNPKNKLSSMISKKISLAWAGFASVTCNEPPRR